jgi:cytochrome P450
VPEIGNAGPGFPSHVREREAIVHMSPAEAPNAVFDPFSQEFRDDPYRSYRTMREAGPVIRTPFGLLMVTRYEPVDRILRSSTFRTPRGYRDANDPAGPSQFDPAGPLSLHRRHWLLFQSGDAHGRLRKLITKVFTPRAVQTLVPRIERLVEALLAPALARGSIEIIGEFAYPLPATVICELLGVPEGDRGQNRAWAAAIAPTLDPTATDEQVAAAEAAMREWDAYTRALIAERRRKPGHALLDAMLAVEEDGSRLTPDEIAANTTFLFLAGHETTTNLIGNGLFALIRHPDQLAALRADPELVAGAIEELLRFDSPVQFTARVAVETTEVEGIEVEAEHPILLALGAANHDERRYKAADTLDVRRRDVKPLSFGGGIHYCVGAALARAEAKAAFQRLVSLPGDLALTDRPEWRPGINLRALKQLPIVTGL